MTPVEYTLALKKLFLWIIFKDLVKHLADLKGHKAYSPDDIPARLLKMLTKLWLQY